MFVSVCVCLFVCVCGYVGVEMCENIHECILGCVCMRLRVCMIFFFMSVCVCLGVFSSSEQSSGNVWVTHEEMENLASSTKAVSTIWVLPSPLPPPDTLSRSHCPHRDTHMSSPGRPLSNVD